MAVRAKHQRLVLLGVALAALLAAGLLAAWALRNQASYFYVPSEIIAKPPEADRSVRLGGMVVRGSMKDAPDGVTVNFLVTDGKAQVPVRFAGIRPALFVEGSGVVAEGIGKMACSPPTICWPSMTKNTPPRDAGDDHRSGPQGHRKHEMKMGKARAR
jgi:cytochrome c-type biogenesis protein CcmE